MRHRIAGNRINMPEPRRRSVRRTLMAGLLRYDRVQTTEARAKSIKAEVETLITRAVNGQKAAWAHLTAVVSDKETATKVLEFARKGRFSLDDKVLSNEERAEQLKAPLTAKGRKFLEDKLAARRADLLKIIADEKEAAEALEAAYEAMVIELHARRIILSALPDELVVKKLFEEIAPRYTSRSGGYTRITKLGRRKGDAAEIAQIALV